MKHTVRIIFIEALVAVFIIATSFFPNPHNDSQEIDMRALVCTMGIDRAEEGIEVSVEIVIPSQQNEGGTDYSVLSEKGETLSIALDNMSMSIGRELEISHCGFVILGEEYCKEVVYPELEYLAASERVSPELNVVVAQGSTAKDFISKISGFVDMSNYGINNIIEYSVNTSKMSTVGILQFLSDCHSPSRSAFLPGFSILPNDTSGESSSTGGSGGSSGGSGGSSGGSSGMTGGSSGGSGGSGGGSAQNGEYKMDHVANAMAFYEGKLMGKLSDEATAGLMWLDRNFHGGTIQIEDIDVKGEHIDYLPCTLVSKSCRPVVKVKDDDVTVTYHISLRMKIDDRHLLNQLKTSWRENGNVVYASIKRAVEKTVISQMEETRKGSLSTECDVMGINELVDKFAHKYVLKHDDVYRTARLDYKISVNIY